MMQLKVFQANVGIIGRDITCQMWQMMLL